MNRIQADPFWDGQSGGVRSSSDGEAGNHYQDPSTHHFEGNGGRSVASLLPGSIRGVVIPRATTLGGSRGFDPHKPRLINIDPDIKGQSCVVDLSQITKEKMDAAFIAAAQNPLAQRDIRLLASQTFHNLAVSYEPLDTGPAAGPRLVERRPPLGGLSGAYVVPRAALGGGQIIEEEQEMPAAPKEIMSPSVSPRTSDTILPDYIKRAVNRGRDPNGWTSNVGIPAPPMQDVDENDVPVGPAPSEEPLDGYQIPQKQIKQGFSDQTPVQQKPARKVKIAGPAPTSREVQTVAPETKVTFEIEGWGEFEAMYHEVIKNDCVLVLVYDNSFKGGMRFFPPSTDKIMAVKVDGQSNVYFVHSYGTRFQHGGYEYCLLVIDQDNEVE